MLKSLFKDSGHPRGAVGKMLLSMMNRGHRTLHEWGIAIAAPSARDSVLDIGCGGGAAMALLLRGCREGRVCGIDVSACGLECSRRKNARYIDEGRCEVREGSAEAIPYPDASFDLVTAFETLYFWRDVDKAFSEILRVLKDGGTFVVANEVSDPSDTTWTEIVEGMTVYAEDEITTRLAASGFTKTIAHRGENGSLCVTAKKPASRR